MAAPGTAIPGTSAGGLYAFGARSAAPEGQLTATIYGLIRDEKYAEAVKILLGQLENFPRSRAALSLLGHCFYQQQDFRSAAQCYEELVRALMRAPSGCGLVDVATALTAHASRRSWRRQMHRGSTSGLRAQSWLVCNSRRRRRPMFP
jgi:tetratricopeptide (TPR) repeat protein